MKPLLFILLDFFHFGETLIRYKKKFVKPAGLDYGARAIKQKTRERTSFLEGNFHDVSIIAGLLFRQTDLQPLPVPFPPQRSGSSQKAQVNDLIQFLSGG